MTYKINNSRRKERLSNHTFIVEKGRRLTEAAKNFVAATVPQTAAPIAAYDLAKELIKKE